MKLEQARMAAAFAVIAAIVAPAAHSAPLPATQEPSSTRFDIVEPTLPLTGRVFSNKAQKSEQKAGLKSSLEARAGLGSLELTSVLPKVEGKLPSTDSVPEASQNAHPVIDAHNGSPSISSHNPSSGLHTSASDHSFDPPPSPDFSAILDSGWDADLFNDIPSLLASSHSHSAHSPPAGTPHGVSAHPGAPSSSQAKSGPSSPDYSAILNGDWDKEDVFSEISSLLNPTAHPSTPPDSHHHYPTGLQPAGASDTLPHDQNAQLGDVRIVGHDGREQEPIRHRSAQDDKPPSAPTSGKGRRKMEQRQPLTFPTMDELELLPYEKYRAATKSIHNYRRRLLRKSNSKDLTEHINLEEVQRRRKARVQAEKFSATGTSASDRRERFSNKFKTEMNAMSPEERSHMWRKGNLSKKKKRQQGKLSIQDTNELSSLQKSTKIVLNRVRAEIREKRQAELKLALHEKHAHAQAEQQAPPSDSEDGDAFHHYRTNILQTP